MFYRSRALFTIAVLAVAGAAFAARRWQTWTPVTACLLCDARNADDAVAGSPATVGAAAGAGGITGSYARSSAGSPEAGSFAGPHSTPATPGSASPSPRLGSAPRGWQPWSASSGSFRVSSSGSPGPSASLGGLWRLMSLSRPGHSGAPVLASNTVETAAAHPAAPIVSRPGTPAAPAPADPGAGGHRPPAPPSPSGGSHSSGPSAPTSGLAAPPSDGGSAPSSGSNGSTPPSGSGGSAPPSGSGDSAPPSGSGDSAPPSGSGDSAPPSGVASSGSAGIAPPSGGSSAGAPPTDPFHAHEDPAPDPFGGPSGGGAFDPGSSGGSAPLPGGGVSATPEPGSVLLIGTGLLGILGVLRRRRLL